MARPSNTAARRQQIVRGLLQVMAAHGYDGASIGEIARVVGLTPGLVHYHFANKQTILLALIEHLAVAGQQVLAIRLEAAGTAPRDRLRAFIDAHLALDEGADPAVLACWVAIGAEAIRQPEVRAAYQAVTLAERRHLLELLQPLLPAAATQAETVAAAILAIIQGYFHLAVTTPELIPAGSAAATTYQAAMGLLASLPVPRPETGEPTP